MSDINDLKAMFRDSSPEFRSVPFWSWNDDLCVDELVRQAKDMKNRGMGGFFMHSREGLETEYMGSDWMKCIRETVNVAKEEGMGAWIYDEDRWPSGAAGGLVPAKGGDAFRSKGLTIEIVKEGSFISDDKVLALFRTYLDNGSIKGCERLEVNTQHTVAENEFLLAFRCEVSWPCEWFNDDAPADNLNPDSVAAFVETTYEVYKKEVGEEFGKTIPGVFTDEPNIANGQYEHTNRGGWIPWTDGFAEYFKAKRDYNILDFLPYIFFKGEKSSKTRHDYWRTISDRFCDAYSKQLGEWCEQNNLAFTGHYLYENELGKSTKYNGAIMPHYRYQHVPGIDMLCEQTQEYLTIKQCTSVANQFGRKRVLTETYGCTGWDLTFEGQKWIGDWQFVLGVNLRCQHLALYSLKGCRKRDFPPVFNYNTSWWKYNNVIEDYFARISTIMSQGKVIRDVLILHPASTAWSMMGNNQCTTSGQLSDLQTKYVDKIGEQFNNFLKLILASHYDFDLGDETIMEEKGRVEDKKVYVNLIGYSVVVIPPIITTLLGSTVKLLEKFMNTGGKVIAVEPLATMIDGQESCKIDKFFKHSNILIAKGQDEVPYLLERLLPREVSIRNKYLVEAPEFLYMLRDLPDCRMFFVVNNDRNNSYDVFININCMGSVEEWNLLTGEIENISVNIIDRQVSFTATFGPVGSRLYIINKNKEPKVNNEQIEKMHHYTAREIYSALGPVCRVTRTMPNALILDRCFFKMNVGDWSEEMDVWQAQKGIRNLLGMRQVFYNGLTQRYKWINKPHPNDNTHVEFRFYFNVDDVPAGDVYLVVEEAKNFEIEFNGNAIQNSPDGWFMDRCFDKIKLPELRKGMNEIILSCNYTNRMEVEDCYIIGDFGVNVNRNIVAEQESLHFGDWCLQGYLNYCGSIIYHFDFNYSSNSNERAVLELEDYSAVTVEIKVNGQTAGHIPWRAANRLDISKFLHGGNNKIDIEVMGSPRNLFGPFHQAAGDLPWTDWSSFRREGSEYTSGYVVKSYGLMGKVIIYKERL